MNSAAKDSRKYGIIDFEYYPYFEKRNGYTDEDIANDIIVFKEFVTSDLNIHIEDVQHHVDRAKDKPNEDDTCIVRFFVVYDIKLEQIASIHKTKLELFSNCPWKDERDDCVFICLANYQKEFIHELNIDKSVWLWERAKNGVIKVSEGYLY